MKLMRIITVFAASLLMMLSCTNKETPTTEYLDVTANNLAGNWEQVEWRGAKLEEASYFYMKIVRKDQLFTFYQNVDSMADMAHVITGRFNIETDPELGAIILGEYDYVSKYWSHRYIVKDLTADTMTWIAVDDPTETKKFVRISSIPVE